MPPVPLAASVNSRPLSSTDTLEADMVVPFCCSLLPNQVGDHRLVFSEPVSKLSATTRLVGAPRLAGASGTPEPSDAGDVVVVVVVDGGPVEVVLVGGAVVVVVLG